MLNQRWRDRRDSYRPDEPINPHAYEVVALPDDTTPKRFIEQHHYSGSYAPARFRFGLYRGAELTGAAVFGQGMPRVVTSVFPGSALDAVELNRFVLIDDVPGNGETWFLARCFELLRAEGLRGVVSFSDPIPRTTADGRHVFPGHIGTIYQAHNGQYLGRGTRRTLDVLPDGTVFSARAKEKLRSGDRGWRYAAAILERHGATSCPETGRAAWLAYWLPRLTRPLRHAGNHRYAWKLTRRTLLVGVPQSYPKRSPLFAA
jgi:hypothetical protein